MAFVRVLGLLLAFVLAVKTIPACASDGPDSVTALVLNPLAPTTLYAGTTERGVLKSTDAGASWSLTGLRDTSVSALAIEPRLPTTVYAVTSSGLLKSVDAAQTWSPTGLMNGSGFLYGFWNPVLLTVGSVATDPVLPGTLYAGITYATSDAFTEYVWGEVWKSSDAGSTWAPITPGGDPWAFPALRSAPAIAAAPATQTNPATVYVTGSYEYDVCWMRGEGYAIGCALLGDTFVGSLSLAVDPRAPDTIYAGTNGAGVYKSTDGGATWSGGGAGVVRSLALAAPHTIYAGTDGLGVQKSMDGGATWSAVNNGLTSLVQALIVDPLTPTTVYAGTTAGVFKSTDGGGNWSLTASASASPLASLTLSPGTVTGGTASTGTVVLNAAAPASGAVVSLSSSNPEVATVAASVTVPPGATSATFAVATNTVTSSSTVTISARLDGFTKAAALTVQPAPPPPAALSTLTLNPASVTGGDASIGTATLTSPAPQGGAVISLSSSNPALAAVSASVTVPAGATSATFAVSTTACTSGSAAVSASYAGITKSAGLSIGSTADNVTVQLADYFAARRELRVAARTSDSSATLRVHVTSSGELIGTLQNLGDGSYSGRFAWSVNPQSITVRSSLCGSATSPVRRRG